MICAGCLDPYYPPASTQRLNALVVDGYVDINGNASVKLSRSIPLDEFGTFPPESNAIVTIETSEGDKMPLLEEKDATYTASGISVSYNSTYKLNIVTSGGQEYESDPTQIYPTPKIDSIYFTIAGSGAAIEVRIDANNTNPNSTRYYAVDGDETYEYHASAISLYKLVNNVAVYRSDEEQVYYCWRDLQASPAVISTNRLSANVVKGGVIAIIGRDDNRLHVRYSDLVKLRSIGEDEYNYLNQVIKTSEQQGSLWSVIPSRFVGNVHNIADRDEYVLGFFSGREITQRRFFVDRFDLPSGFGGPQPEGCQAESTCALVEGIVSPPNCINVEDIGRSVIVAITADAAGTPLYYKYVQAQCGDCTSLGGYTKRPAFW
ncbi:MAG: DUF4249 domain-containing protein [Bacteroidota bacterium]